MHYIAATFNLTVYDSGQIRIEAKYFQKFVKYIEKEFIEPAIKRIFNLNDIVAAHHFMEGQFRRRQNCNSALNEFLKTFFYDIKILQYHT